MMISYIESHFPDSRENAVPPMLIEPGCKLLYFSGERPGWKSMGQFFEELKRRNVIRMGAAYLAGAWLVIQLVETLFPVFEMTDASIRAVVIVLAIGFPIVLVLSWVFELTPDGLKPDSAVHRDQSAVRRSTRRFDRLVIAVLSLAVGFFTFDKFVLEPARDESLEQAVTNQLRSELLATSFGQRSLAVLPFVNFSGDPGDEYFSDGISEEILNRLANVPDLRVISRSSSFSFKDVEIDMMEIAEQLNVAYILEGSVRKAGSRVRITAKLIDANSDTQLWSDNFEQEFGDIFATQDEMALAIVDALREKLPLDTVVPEQSRYTSSSEAYDAYLRGRHLVVQRTPERVKAAIREFKSAIEIDPAFALAHAELAIASIISIRTPTGDTDALKDIAPIADKAMSLAPLLAESHAAVGHVVWLEGSPEAAVQHFIRATELNPSYADGYLWIGLIYEYELGMYTESFAAREMSVRLDPLSVSAISNYAYGLIWRNRFADAERQIEKLESLLPPHGGRRVRNYLASLGGNWSNFALGTLALMLADETNARLKIDLSSELALIGLETEALAVLDSPEPFVLGMLGNTSQAVDVAQSRLEQQPDSMRRRLDLGVALAGLGQHERARPMLEEWYQARRHTYLNGDSTFLVAALVAARRATGDSSSIDELLVPIREEAERAVAAGISVVTAEMSADFLVGLTEFLSGNEVRGIELIGKAVTDGYFIYPNQAYLQNLYDHPAFNEIREIQTSRQERERDKFLDVVCNDNPYADIWRPQEITCSAFDRSGIVRTQ